MNEATYYQIFLADRPLPPMLSKDTVAACCADFHSNSPRVPIRVRLLTERDVTSEFVSDDVAEVHED